MLVGSNAKNKVTANEFADWMMRKDVDQKVVAGFKKSDFLLYDTIPEGVNPLGRVASVLGLGTPKPGRAVMQIPGTDTGAYFFQGSKYLGYNSGEDKKPHNIMEDWQALRQAGFKTVDAIIQMPPGSTNV